MNPQLAPPLHGLTVIFKGSNRCNAGCTYCAVGEAGGRTVTWDDFEHTALQLEELVLRRGVGRINFTFHGGEPTLLGADFIDRACERIGKLRARVSFSMQSNLLHWNDALLGAVQRHAIAVGTSLDPIAGDRLDGAGRDAFPAWTRNYLRLSEKIKAPGAIFVVTRRALGKAARLYEVAESLAAATGQTFGLQINPVYAQGKAAGQDELLVSPEEFGGFLIEMWRAWRDSSQTVRLTPIQDFSDHFFPVEGRRPILSCSFSGACSRHHVGIDFDLNVAGCGRRLDSRAFLGNLREQPLCEILDRAGEPSRIDGRSALLRQGACAGCRFFALCNGGCPDDADLAGDLMARFCWCAGYRMLFEAMEEEARRQAARKERGGEEVLAVLDPSELDQSRGRAARATWLLPTEDARALRFEAGLAQRLAGRPGQKLIFVHNRRVRSLALWEGLLRDPEVAVALFEAEGLQEALDFLGGLRANVWLDAQGLVAAPGGAELVDAAVQRFLFEERWESRLTPFAQILLDAVRGATTPHLDRFGQPAGASRLELSAEAASDLPPAAAALLLPLRREEGFTLTEWLRVRGPCQQCDCVPICGGQFAAGDGAPCHPRLRQIVGRLAEVAGDLRARLDRRVE